MSFKTVTDSLTGATKVGIDVVSRTRGIIALSSLALASIGALGAAKALAPTAVADNSGKFILNETLKTSLAKARQDNEVLKRAKKLEESLIGRRLPHDQFI